MGYGTMDCNVDNLLGLLDESKRDAMLLLIIAKASAIVSKSIPSLQTVQGYVSVENPEIHITKSLNQIDKFPVSNYLSLLNNNNNNNNNESDVNVPTPELKVILGKEISGTRILQGNEKNDCHYWCHSNRNHSTTTK